jgi:hypothetical protein
MYSLEDTTKLGLWNELAKSCSWWWPYQNICIMSERPLEIHKKGIQLHKDDGAAFVSRDGYKMWYLNGVNVPQWLVETNSENIDCQEFAKISNVEVRREFLRKVGVERLCQKLGSKIINRRGAYELHLIDLGERVGKHPYLKMLNPSIGCWHMEAVGKECTTVEQAINFRAQRMGVAQWNPSTLT